MNHIGTIAPATKLSELLREGIHRAAGWMHLVAALFVFTSDFLNPQIPHCTLVLFVGATCIFVLLWFLARSGKVKNESIAAVFVFFGLMSMLSLGVFAWQKIWHDPREGAITKQFPELTPIQNSLDNLLHALRVTNRKLDENSAVQQKSQQLNLAVIAAVRKDITALNREKGVPIPVLHAILVRLGETKAGDDVDEIVRLLREKADEYVLLERAMAAFSPIDPHARELQSEAARDVARSDFGAARAKLHQAARIDEAAVAALSDLVRRRCVDAARALEQSGDIAKLQIQYLDSANDYETASHLLALQDPKSARRLTILESEALYLQGDEFGDNAALAKVIVLDRAILSGVSPSAHDPDWAILHDQLGRALLRLGERDPDTKRFDDALAVLREGLASTPREREPLEWATLEDDLGDVLVRLGERDRGSERIELGAEAYRESLKVRTLDRVPAQWGMTETNLGLALTDLGLREAGVAHLKEATEAFRNALSVITRQRSPVNWALAQNNLGTALFALGEKSRGTVALEESAGAFRLALEEYTRTRAPQQWAMAEINLGGALGIIGDRRADSAEIQNGLAAERLAMQIFTRHGDPEDWALGEDYLATTLRELGKRESGTENLVEALTAERSALTVITREGAPVDWSQSQYDLGLILELLGERTQGSSGVLYLNQAIMADRAALTERRRELYPLDWAETQYHLGLSLEALSGRSTGQDEFSRLAQAITAYKSTLLVMQENHLDFYDGIALEDVRRSINHAGLLEAGFHTSPAK